MKDHTRLLASAQLVAQRSRSAGAGLVRWAAQGCLRVGCAARLTNTLQYCTERFIFAFSLSPYPLESGKPHCAVAWPVGVRPLPPCTAPSRRR